MQRNHFLFLKKFKIPQVPSSANEPCAYWSCCLQTRGSSGKSCTRWEKRPSPWSSPWCWSWSCSSPRGPPARCCTRCCSCWSCCALSQILDSTDWVKRQFAKYRNCQYSRGIINTQLISAPLSMLKFCIVSNKLSTSNSELTHYWFFPSQFVA